MQATRRLTYIPSPPTRAYVLNLLRENDNENYLANLLQPTKSVQRTHAAIRAFNIELAHIRTSVSNEDLGRLRIAHFRSSLDDLLSGDPAPQTPIMECLAEAVTEFPHVNFGELHTLIDARERDLGYPNHLTLDSLETFARETQGVLIGLHASILGKAVKEAADLAGTAVGLAIVLRGVPAHAASRLSYMPSDVIRSTGVSQKSLLLGGEEASQVFQHVAYRAESLLREADDNVFQLDKAVKPAFWPLRMAELYLGRLRRFGYNPFNETLQRGLRTTYPLALQIRLLRRRMFG